jgi:hypothetical protein
MARAERAEQKGLDRPEGKLVHRAGPNSAVMVEVSEYNDVTYLNIRKWAKVAKLGGWIRTGSGVSIPVENAGKLVKAIKQAVEE